MSSSAWTMKRFWTTVTVVPAPGGFAIELDGRPVRTPAKAALVVPTQGLATLIAAEWNAQSGKVDPGTMPATRAANAAIDKVTAQKAEVAGLLAAYGASDLLCYRAEQPDALVARQAAGWDPVLDWAAARFGAKLKVGPGVVPVAQDQVTLDRLTAAVTGQDVFQLAAFHDLVALSGSLVLALAVIEGRITPDDAWNLSRIDETWQEEQWGRDDDAVAAAAIKHAAFLDAARFHVLASQANAT